jgi:predicted membrane-bound spermidine synthase
MHKISYSDLNTKFSISLILINSISGMFYFSRSAFFGILVGKEIPLLMNLPLFLAINKCKNANAFKLKFYDFFDFIFLLYTAYLLVNAVYETIAD